MSTNKSRPTIKATETQSDYLTQKNVGQTNDTNSTNVVVTKSSNNLLASTSKAFAESVNNPSSGVSSSGKSRLKVGSGGTVDSEGRLTAIGSSTSDLNKRMEQVHAYPNPPMDLEATTGKKAESRVSICQAQIATLQKLVGEAQKAYDDFRSVTLKEINALKDITGVVDAFAPKVNEFVTKRIQSADALALRMLNECKKVCDPTQIYYRKMIYITLMNLDFVVVSKAFNKYEDILKKIEEVAAKIKKSNEAELKEILVESSAGTFGEKLPIPKDKQFGRIIYNMKMYVVFPDSTQHYVHPYITDFLYTKDFDNNSVPIYSAIFKLPPATLDAIRRHFGNLKWFLTISSKPYSPEQTNDEFVLENIVIDNVELTGIDPKFSNTNGTKGDEPYHNQPTASMKCDFIMKRELQANAEPSARVLNNARVIDAIAYLCGRLAKTSKSAEVDTSKEIKFAITPPDNNKIYPQIIIRPGSFSDSLNHLQRVYGIYQAGLRIAFDTNHQVKGSTKKQSTDVVNLVTITEKGTPVPVPDGQENVVIEIVDPRNTTFSGYDIGCYIDHSIKTTTIRTIQPYVLQLANSPSIIKGEGVRVMNTSQSDHIVSICDNQFSDLGSQRIVWSDFSNPFTLTQYQDSIREEALGVALEVLDVDLLSLNDNMNYNLKFYTPDDDIASGMYRLARMELVFRHGRTTDKNYMLSTGRLLFKDKISLRAAGSEVPRFSYSEKLLIAAEEQGGGGNSANSSKGMMDKTDTRAALNETRKHSGFTLAKLPSKPKAGAENSEGKTYRCRFGGRKDFYGKDIPVDIPDTYEMSKHTILADVFNTTTGNLPNMEPVSLLSNYEYFINTQRFASTCVDKIIDEYGKFKGENGKARDWFRTKGDTKSAHLTGEAIDIKLKPGGEKEMIDSFIELISRDLGFTHLALEGNGKEWTHIHFEATLGTQEKRISVSPYGTRYTKLVPDDYTGEEALALLKDNLSFSKAKTRFQ